MSGERISKARTPFLKHWRSRIRQIPIFSKSWAQSMQLKANLRKPKRSIVQLYKQILKTQLQLVCSPACTFSKRILVEPYSEYTNKLRRIRTTQDCMKSWVRSTPAKRTIRKP